MYEPNKIKYEMYKKWFQFSIAFFLIAILVFIYFRLFRTGSVYTIHSFFFAVIGLGWTATAYQGMKLNKGER